MQSLLLYDTRDNSIAYCQTKGYGSCPFPAHKDILRSARIPENEKDYYGSIKIVERMITPEAKKQLRILENEAIKKPKVELTANKQEIVLSNNPEFTVTVNIYDTINNDNFSSVDMLINDVSFSINITDNSGDKVIELSETDTYTIACDDDRFVSQPVEVVAVG